MAKYYSIHVVATVMLALIILPRSSFSQTYCSLKIQVPNMDFCDASGLLEVDVKENIYETKGNINGFQDYQNEAFELFDQQLTNIVESSDPAEGTMQGIQEEIEDLAHLLNNIQAAEALDDTLSRETGAREKRAVSSSQAQLQQLLDAAKLTFQQALANVAIKLQNLTKIIADNAKQTSSMHTKLQTELNTNHQSLLTSEQELKTIDADIQKLVTSGSGGPTGVNISSLTQDVTDLLVNARVAEQIHERQLDTVDKLIQKMEADEAQVQPEIQRSKADMSTIDSTLTKDERSIAITKGGERIFEDRVGQFLYNATNDVATVKTKLASDKADIVKVGNQVVTALTTIGAFSKDLKQTRNSVDGVQSVVSFASKAQQNQSGQILTMNKVVNDDVKLMKYAFGLLTSHP